MTTFDFYPEIQSSRFVDIDQLEHRFPNNVKELGVSVTLLHSHHHCKKNHAMVFKFNFIESNDIKINRLNSLQLSSRLKLNIYISHVKIWKKNRSKT